jgi:hypothetical protein
MLYGLSRELFSFTTGDDDQIIFARPNTQSVHSHPEDAVFESGQRRQRRCRLVAKDVGQKCFTDSRAIFSDVNEQLPCGDDDKSHFRAAQLAKLTHTRDLEGVRWNSGSCRRRRVAQRERQVVNNSFTDFRASFSNGDLDDNITLARPHTRSLHTTDLAGRPVKLRAASKDA